MKIIILYFYDFLINKIIFSQLTIKFFEKIHFKMNCKCKHCIEVRNQHDRAEKRQAELLKEKSTKLMIRR